MDAGRITGRSLARLHGPPALTVHASSCKLHLIDCKLHFLIRILSMTCSSGSSHDESHDLGSWALVASGNPPDCQVASLLA